MREVVLVCGPPCAGKTSWVRSQAGPDDVVIDLDDIERWAGSRQAARDVRADLEALAAEWDGRVFVVRTLARREDREQVARRLGADRVHVLVEDRDELCARAVSRPHGTTELIDRWLAEFEPSPLDQPL